jgi:hypothetical protein
LEVGIIGGNVHVQGIVKSWLEKKKKSLLMDRDGPSIDASY